MFVITDLIEASICSRLLGLKMENGVWFDAGRNLSKKLSRLNAWVVMGQGGGSILMGWWLRMIHV